MNEAEKNSVTCMLIRFCCMFYLHMIVQDKNKAYAKSRERERERNCRIVEINTFY